MTPENIGRVEYMLSWMTTQLQNDKKFAQQDKPITTSYSVTPAKFTQMMDTELQANVDTLGSKFNISASVTYGADHGIIRLGEMKPELQIAYYVRRSYWILRLNLERCR